MPSPRDTGANHQRHVPPIDTLPRPLRTLLAKADLDEIDVGMSGARVLRVAREGRATHFLKTATQASEDDLTGEVARLLWLAGRLPVPRVEYFGSDGQQQCLLMSAVPGRPAYEVLEQGGAAESIRLLAAGLRMIHALPVAECPFDMRLDLRIADAGRRAEAGLVDEADFDDERLGRSAADLFAELCEKRDVAEDLVVTHGDFCLPNVLITPTGDGSAGFVDVGRAGVGDRYQDLALAARSVVFNLGPEWVPRFFDAYGISHVDTDKVALFQLLDEFF